MGPDGIMKYKIVIPPDIGGTRPYASSDSHVTQSGGITITCLSFKKKH